MAKVIFFFAGTGRSNDEYAREHNNYLDFPSDVVRIYVNGCQDIRVGGVGGMISPDLEVVAGKVASAFSTSHGDCLLNIKALQQSFQNTLIIEPDINDFKVKVDSLALEGYSRGAVTTFAVAKKLKNFNVDVDIDIIANQPVPGEQFQRTLYNRYKDLSDLQHVKSFLLLGAGHEEDGLGWLHRYFKTMIPITHENTIRDDILLPQQKHIRSTTNPEKGGPNNEEPIETTGILGRKKKHKNKLISTPVPYHIAKALKKRGYASINSKELDAMNELVEPSDVSYNNLDPETFCLKSWYASQSYYFTPMYFAQKLHATIQFGLRPSQIYVDLQLERANKVLNEYNKDPLLKEDEEDKAVAIMDVYAAFEGEPEKRSGMIQKILDHDAHPLSTIIKETTFSCLHLSSRTKIKGCPKGERIKKESIVFQREVFSACVDYLDNPDPQSLVDRLKTAKNTFVTNAQISDDRDSISSVLRCILRCILSVLGISKPDSHCSQTFFHWATNSLEVKSLKILNKIEQKIIKNANHLTPKQPD